MRRLENSHYFCVEMSVVGSGVYIGLSLELTTDHYFLEPSEDQRNKSIIYNRHSPMIPNIINPYGIYNYSAIIDTIVYYKIVYLASIRIYSPLHFCLPIFSPNRRHHILTGQPRATEPHGFQGTHQPQQPTTQGPSHNKSYGGSYHEPTPFNARQNL